MAGDATATKQRLIATATREFSAYGIAGARVDRIAADSGSNKAQIYHYFGSKEALFAAAFNDVCVKGIDTNPIDVTNLPEYAGRIFDGYAAHPEIARLLYWYRLEGQGRADPIALVVESLRHKAQAIGGAQADGLVSTAFSPEELLGLILHLSEIWCASTPEFATLAEGIAHDRRRQVVVDAVAAMIGYRRGELDCRDRQHGAFGRGPATGERV